MLTGIRLYSFESVRKFAKAFPIAGDDRFLVGCHRVVPVRIGMGRIVIDNMAVHRDTGREIL